MTTPRHDWRATVNSLLVFNAKLLGLLAWREAGISKLEKRVLDVAIPLADELIDAAQRHQDASVIAAITRAIDRRIWNALTPFTRLALGRHESLQFDPYMDRKSTLEWCARLDREHEESAAPAASHQRSATG